MYVYLCVCVYLCMCVCVCVHLCVCAYRITHFGYALAHWLRAAINHWIWAAVPCRRAWARVILAGHEGRPLDLAPEAGRELGLAPEAGRPFDLTPEAGRELKALADWFFTNPGCCKLMGSIMLLYFREPVRDDLQYIDCGDWK